jgi:TetR/AcrR family transcriptional regulator, ethionamide resistance regulator
VKSDGPAETRTLDELRQAGRRSATRRQRSRENQILDAAEQLLAEVGLHRLEVTQIIARAEISRTTFYLYFESKFDVVAGLLMRALGEMRHAVRRWVSDDGTGADAQLRTSLEAAAAVWARHHAVFNSASGAWTADPALREIWVAEMDAFSDMFTAAAGRDPRLTIRDDHALRTTVAALVWSTERVLFVTSVAATPRLEDMRAAAATLSEIWIKTLFT